MSFRVACKGSFSQRKRLHTTERISCIHIYSVTISAFLRARHWKHNGRWNCPDPKELRRLRKHKARQLGVFGSWAAGRAIPTRTALWRWASCGTSCVSHCPGLAAALSSQVFLVIKQKLTCEALRMLLFAWWLPVSGRLPLLVWGPWTSLVLKWGSSPSRLFLRNNI